MALNSWGKCLAEPFLCICACLLIFMAFGKHCISHRLAWSLDGVSAHGGGEGQTGVVGMEPQLSAGSMPRVLGSGSGTNS